MEHINNTISTIQILNTDIHVTYDNDEVEIIQNNLESYIKMRETWLIDQPPFISDKYKMNMNNIILASIQKKQSSINDLKTFFSEGNEEIMKNFFIYMRNRDLTFEKSKWTRAS